MMGRHERIQRFTAALLTILVAGCSQPGSDAGAAAEAETAPPQAPEAAPADASAGDAEVAEPEPEPEPIDPAHLVLAYRDGEARDMDDREAAAKGLTIIDLRDTWAPAVLRGTEELPSSYEKVYVDLANERGETVEDADPETANYYLEVYGISPSPSTILKRLEREQARECFRHIDYEALRNFKGFRAYRGRPRDELRKASQSIASLERQIERLMKKQGVASFEEITDNDNLVERWRKKAKRVIPLREAQKRLACEQLFPGRGGFIDDTFDWATHIALLNFERRHRLYGWGYFNEETAHALAWNPEETAFHTLKRALTERVMDAAGVIEDGSTFRNGKAPTYVGADGSKQKVRNLEQEFTEAAMSQLGFETADDVVAFLQERDFSTLRLALPLPEVPEYYSEHMDLEAYIDRGDVWYDYPYDDQGNEITQPIGRRPTLTLYTNYRGQKIALIQFGTTIGGWRSTVRDSVEHWAYKNSDIGPRVWKNIVGGPSWIPPNSTPVRDLVVKHRRHGRLVYEANQGELGPGYASAYGMVMGINHQEIERDGSKVYLDNGIRVHGSVSYQSIQKRHSHGCHRLHNHLALRLFDFVLDHRNHTRVGQEVSAYSRPFEFEEKAFRVEVRTRGYFYELEPPVPIMVNQGRILGSQQTPITEYVIKPSERDRLRREAEAAAQADAGVAPEGTTDDGINSGGVPAPAPEDG
jgi:hypothetical protein